MGDIGTGAGEADVKSAGVEAGFGFELDGGKNAGGSKKIGEGGAGETDNTATDIDNITKIVLENVTGFNLNTGLGGIRVDDFDFGGIVVDDDVGGIGSTTLGIENNIDGRATALVKNSRGRIEGISGGIRDRR